jgi:hypothetical protein
MLRIVQAVAREQLCYPAVAKPLLRIEYEPAQHTISFEVFGNLGLACLIGRLVQPLR